MEVFLLISTIFTVKLHQIFLALTQGILDSRMGMDLGIENLIWFMGILFFHAQQRQYSLPKLRLS